MLILNQHAGFSSDNARRGGNDAFTTLLLHLNGADGATSFPDASASALSFTAAGNAQIDTADSKFGGASLLLDGAGDHLSLANNSAFDFTGDFAIDFWFKTSTNTTCVWNQGTSNTGGMLIVIGNGGATGVTSGKLGVWAGTGGSAVALSSTTTVTDGAWRHGAITRGSGTLRVFVNGVVEASGSHSANLTQNATQYLGSTGSGSYFNGWIDEFRVSNGDARWTSNFTPSSFAYR